MKRFFLALSVTTLFGCSNITPVIVKAIVKNSVSFTIGQVQEKNLGEPMVVEEKLRFSMAPVAVFDFTPPEQAGARYPTIKEGMTLKPYGRMENGDILYTNPDLKPRTLYGDPVTWEYCLAINKDGVLYGDAACALGLVRAWPEPPAGLVEVRPVYWKGSLRKELIYNGRAGSVLKISYREYMYNSARPAFYQDLTYDLGSSSTIRFKGMEIEVLDATNSAIKFIVRTPMEKPAEHLPFPEPVNTDVPPVNRDI